MMPLRLPWFWWRISNVDDRNQSANLSLTSRSWRQWIPYSIFVTNIYVACLQYSTYHLTPNLDLYHFWLIFRIFTKKFSPKIIKFFSFRYWNSKSLLRLVCEATQINRNKIIFCIWIDLFVFKILYICIEWLNWRLPHIHASILTQMS